MSQTRFFTSQTQQIHTFSSLFTYLTVMIVFCLGLYYQRLFGNKSLNSSHKGSVNLHLLKTSGNVTPFRAN